MAVIEHAGLSVADLERSIEFYTEVMGLTLVRTIDTSGDSRLGEVVGLENCVARIAHLESEGGMLEHFGYKRPKGKPVPVDRNQSDLGFSHIGFSSKDARTEYRRLAGRGVEVMHTPVEFRPDVWIFYFRGPDGEVCEIRETPIPQE